MEKKQKVNEITGKETEITGEDELIETTEYDTNDSVKRKTLYEYSFRVYTESDNDYQNLIRKAGQQITTLTFLGGIYGFLGNDFLKKVIFNDKLVFCNLGIIKLSVLILYSFSILLLLGTWFYSIISSIKIVYRDRLPLSEKTLEDFQKKTVSDLYIRYSKTFLHATNENRNINKNLAENINKAYISVIISAISFLFAFILYAIYFIS